MLAALGVVGGITPACAGTTHGSASLCSSLGDHPRVCGDYSLCPWSYPILLGSPPRVRGLPCGIYTSGGVTRITPACAGTTGLRRGSRAVRRDHPRVCGDYWGGNGTHSSPSGSPPRVRGLLRKLARRPQGRRITPACAGTTLFHDAVDFLAEDHPRVCGDYLAVRAAVNKHPGSPPRVRGLLRLLRPRHHRQRITPACAGTTTRHNLPKVATWDHPRVCGDYDAHAATISGHAGSPPRVRGLRSACSCAHRPHRITPACAGTTSRRAACVSLSWDHPRVCGDYAAVKGKIDNLVGSPPRVRGLLSASYAAVVGDRITPACAGTTPQMRPVPDPHGDHPRVCGDYPTRSPARMAAMGSPPRVRGLLYPE